MVLQAEMPSGFWLADILHFFLEVGLLPTAVPPPTSSWRSPAWDVHMNLGGIARASA